MKIKKIILLMIMGSLVLSGCSSSLHAPYLELRKNVIPIDSNKTHNFFVGKVMVGETPVVGLYRASINPEDIAGALKINLENYDLLENESHLGEYKIDLDITFSESGVVDLLINSLGKYLITNTKNNSTLSVTVNEVYTAKYDLSVKSWLAGGLVGAAVGGPVGSGVGGSVVTQEATKDLADQDNPPVSLTIEERRKLKDIGYAPSGVPTNADSAEIKMLRAYEGSIRLNIATFIEKTQSLELP